MARRITWYEHSDLEEKTIPKVWSRAVSRPEVMVGVLFFALSLLADDDVLFAQVRVDPETGTVAWPNGADLDPDVLHGDYEPARSAQAKS